MNASPRPRAGGGWKRGSLSKVRPNVMRQLLVLLLLPPPTAHDNNISLGLCPLYTSNPPSTTTPFRA